MTSTASLSPEDLHAQGIQLHRAGRLAEAADCYRQALEEDPHRDVVWSHLGSALCQAGRYKEGASAFATYIQHASPTAAAHADLARALRAAGALADARKEYARAVEIGPEEERFWVEYAATLTDLGECNAAAHAYDRATQLKPQVATAAAHSRVLLAAGRPHAAVRVLETAALRNPGDATPWILLGELRQGLGSLDEALATYDRGILVAELDAKQNDTLARLLYRRAALRANTSQFRLAALDTERLRTVDPQYPYAAGLQLYVSMMNCDWDVLDARLEDALSEVRRGMPYLPPWVVIAATDRPEVQLISAQTWARTMCVVPSMPLWNGQQYRHDRIRLAYVSADFGDHPVAHSLARILGNHDREVFELIGVAVAQVSPGPLTESPETLFDRFLDGTRIPDLQIAAWMREQEVDIAIDLTGYTARGRPSIFAARPAPVQVSYLGYPGTMGAPFMDYLIADPVVVPPDSAQYFSERIAYMPGCLLPPSVDERPARAPSRGELGLPDDAVVFAALHTTYKFTRPMFDIWLRILQRAPDAVLWLAESSREVGARLRTTASAQGVDPDRLIFAQRVPRREAHLARLSRADLFLDTLPYNAHTSAADALRSGVPVLTCAGRSFAARVGASLLRSKGLYELAADSLAEYENLAVSLAYDRPRLRGLRERLEGSPTQSSQLEGARYVAELEDLFRNLLSGLQTPRALG